MFGWDPLGVHDGPMTLQNGVFKIPGQTTNVTIFPVSAKYMGLNIEIN